MHLPEFLILESGTYALKVPMRGANSPDASPYAESMWSALKQRAESVTTLKSLKASNPLRAAPITGYCSKAAKRTAGRGLHPMVSSTCPITQS